MVYEILERCDGVYFLHSELYSIVKVPLVVKERILNISSTKKFSSKMELGHVTTKLIVKAGVFKLFDASCNLQRVLPGCSIDQKFQASAMRVFLILSQVR